MPRDAENSDLMVRCALIHRSEAHVLAAARIPVKAANLTLAASASGLALGFADTAAI